MFLSQPFQGGSGLWFGVPHVSNSRGCSKPRIPNPIHKWDASTRETATIRIFMDFEQPSSRPTSSDPAKKRSSFLSFSRGVSQFVGGKERLCYWVGACVCGKPAKKKKVPPERSNSSPTPSPPIRGAKSRSLNSCLASWSGDTSRNSRGCHFLSRISWIRYTQMGGSLRVPSFWGV